MNSYNIALPTLVLTPMITAITPSSPLLRSVNDNVSLTCMGMGGPRLVLTWEMADARVANGAMGGDILQYNFTANNDTFGTYTCISTIDNMETSKSVDVVGMYSCKC